MRSILASLSAAALTTAGLVAVTGPAEAAGPAVSVWETTADQSRLLSPQAGATFNAGNGSGGQTITINPDTTYQSMAGFGASFTDSSAWLVFNSPQRNAIMTKLFDPSQGAGIDFLRQPIGASDFSRSTFSYDDTAGDTALSHFSVAHDNAYVLPLLQQAKQINPATTFMATPWSPPAWMKTSNSMIHGTLTPADRTAYAGYFVKFIQAYGAAGVPISLVTPQNEPDNDPGNYPGMKWPSTDEATFVNSYLGPAIQNAGLSTKILAYDHNWDDPGYPSTVLTNAGNYTAGTAWHCYGGDVSAQNTVHSSFPSKDTYFTECSGTQSANTANTFGDTLMWQTEHLMINATRDWAKSVVTWNMALDPSGGPSMNCTTCTGVVTVNGSNVSYNAEYYMLGQASKFVKPGAVRIDSNSFGGGGLEDVAFKNPDGSHVLLVQNASGSSNTFNVSENGQSFTYTLPGRSVATFVWTPGTTGGGGGSTGIDSTKWYSVANVNSGKCLGAAGGSTANGTALQQSTCTTGNTGQQWQFQPTDSGFAKVVARNATTQAWNVTGGTGATGNGVKVQLWAYGGGTNEQWQAVAHSDGTYSFSPRNNTGNCLDVTDVSTADGAALQQWACSSGPAQSFRLTAQS
ncbi:MAG TPA: RICIN domain-containing protein [Actinoplanes sp.]|jgi:glucosylceramidase